MIGGHYLNLVLSRKDYGLIRNVKDIDELFVIPTEKQVLDFVKEHWQKYGQVPDPTTVVRKFPEFDLLEVDESPEALLHDLREQKLALEVRPVLEQAAKLYQDDATKSVSYLQEQVVRLAKMVSSDINLYDYTKGGAARLEDYRMRASLEGMIGIPTGIPGLDSHTMGWWNGHLNLIGGRLNEGKTWVGLLHAAVAWQHGHKVAFWSLESGEDEMSFRLDTLIAKIPNMALFSGKLEEKQFERWMNYLEDLKKEQPLYILTNANNGGNRWTADQIARVIEEQKIDFAVIDQASLMDDGGKSRTVRERFINVATDSKTRATDTNIPWMLLTQLNRDAANIKGDDVGGMEQISESDALGQFADRAVLLRQLPPLMKMGLRKNRFGQKDIDFILKWDVNEGVIEEMGNLEGAELF